MQAGLLLNLLIAAVTGKEVTRYLRTETQTSDYDTHQIIVAAPKNYDLLSHLNLGEREHKILWEGPIRTYHQLNLTDAEEDQLDKNLKIITGEVGGLISNDIEITAEEYQDSASVVASAYPQYVIGNTRCQQTLSNLNMKYLVFIMDGYINTNNTALSGMPIKQQFNLVGATPGILTHGSKVAELLLGGNDGFIQASGIEAIGLTVFGDNGKGWVSSLLSAASQIKKMIPALKKQGYILGATFSGNSSPNSLLDISFKELSLLLPVTVSAGNIHADCTQVSPPNAGGNVIPVGGTSDSNGKPIHYYNSVWGCGKNMVYTPYCSSTHSFNPSASPVFNGKSTFCGTSRAAPDAHRIHAYYSCGCPTCNIEQRIGVTVNATVSIESSVGPISVFPIANACPLDNTALFDSYKTINGKYSPKYNSTTGDGRLCATFRINKGNKNPNSQLLIALDGNVLRIPAKNTKVASAFKQYAYANFVVTASNPITGKNNVNVFVQTPSGMQSMLNAFATNKIEHIAFGSKSWVTNVTSARKCALPLLKA